MSDVYSTPIREVNLTVERGVTLESFTFNLNNADGTPYDLTDATITGVIRDAAEESVGTLTCSVETALEGEIRVDMPATDTAAISTGSYHYDVIVTLGDGVTVLRPPIGGEFRVRKTYTLL